MTIEVVGEKPDSGEAQPTGDPEMLLPVIQVGWDDRKQMPFLKFDSQEFRRWEWVVAVLQAGLEQAEKMKRFSDMQELGAAMQQAQAQQALMKQRNSPFVKGRRDR